MPIPPSWHKCSRLTPAVKYRAQLFRSMHHGKHSASARFFLEVRLSPRIRLQQFACATTPHGARFVVEVSAPCIPPYSPTGIAPVLPNYQGDVQLLAHYEPGKGVGWAWTPNGHYPIGRRGVVVQNLTIPYPTVYTPRDGVAPSVLSPR